MFNEFKEWVEAVLGGGYLYSPGMWVESAASADARYVVVQSSGGPGMDVDDRRPRYRLILLGRRGQRQDYSGLLVDADALVQAAIDGAAPCGAAHVRAIAEPVGPGYTAENRAWVQVDFEVLF